MCGTLTQYCYVLCGWPNHALTKLSQELYYWLFPHTHCKIQGCAAILYSTTRRTPSIMTEPAHGQSVVGSGTQNTKINFSTTMNSDVIIHHKRLTVIPTLSFRDVLAPWVQSNSTTSRKPRWEAQWSAVCPSCHNRIGNNNNNLNPNITFTLFQYLSSTHVTTLR